MALVSSLGCDDGHATIQLEEMLQNSAYRTRYSALTPRLPVDTWKDEQDDSVRVVGSFRDSAGKPIGDVVLVNQQSGSLLGLSDPDGVFNIVLEQPERAVARPWSVVALHGSFAAEELRGDVPPGWAASFGEVPLSPGGAVIGRVLMTDKEPAQDPFVFLARNQPEGSDETRARSDGPNLDVVFAATFGLESGEYYIIGVPPGEWVVWARNNCAPWEAAVIDVRGAQTTRADVQLPPMPNQYLIGGVVLNEEDQAVAGIEVEAAYSFEDPNFIFSVSEESDDDGVFRLCLFPPPTSRTVRLVAKDPNGRFDNEVVRLAEPGDLDIVLRMRTLHEIHIEVVDSTDQPIEEFGWTLLIYRDSGNTWNHEAISNRQNGKAVLQVPDSPFELTIRSKDGNKRLGLLHLGLLSQPIRVEM